MATGAETMAKAGQRATPILDKKATVIARTDLRDVPEGTKGKVVLVNGLSWIRYWVRFDNGVSMGSVNRANLATPAEWQRHLNGEDESRWRRPRRTATARRRRRRATTEAASR